MKKLSIMLIVLLSLLIIGCTVITEAEAVNAAGQASKAQIHACHNEPSCWNAFLDCYHEQSCRIYRNNEDKWGQCIDFCLEQAEEGEDEVACIPTLNRQEVCDGRDNDCDGGIDNVPEEDLQDDDNNCGACGNSCGENEVCEESVCVNLCGNGVVDESETCSSCPADAGCGFNEACIRDQCIEVVCRDNDNGRNYEQISKTWGWEPEENPQEVITRVDSCTENGNLIEHYCELGEDGLERVLSEVVVCSDWEMCKNGACVRKEYIRRVWTRIQPEEIAIIGKDNYTTATENNTIAISEINFQVSQTVYGAWVVIYKENPTLVHNFEGEIYQHAWIRKSPTLQDELLRNITIHFKIDNTWLEENDLNEEDISLFRSENDEWIELETVLEENDDSYQYYSASAPGFGYFVIGHNEPTYEIRLEASGNRRYELTWHDLDGSEVNMPLAYLVGENHLLLGDRRNNKLILSEGEPIRENDYFVITIDEGSYLLQYKGADSNLNLNPKIDFKHLGTQERLEFGVSQINPITTISLGGQDFIVNNASNVQQGDFDIFVDLNGDGEIVPEDPIGITDFGGKPVTIRQQNLEQIGLRINDMIVSIGIEIDPLHLSATLIRGCELEPSVEDEDVSSCGLVNGERVTWRHSEPEEFTYSYSP